ncbi:MAG TPA: condensation domain-containing protein, partial [Longimicrobiaceae bacterium]|nr:condensation domain-containing protein [Longimicrobiaceae bacterium]
MSETTRPTTGRPGLSPAKQALLEKLKRGGVAGTGPIRRRGPDAPVAASFAQQRLVLLDQLIYDRATYNLPLALRLAGALDVGALERAIQEVARRHEALRTTFRIGVDPPEQVVAPELHVTLPVGDLSRPSAAEREEEAGRRLEDEARRHFDLSAGPLFRGLLLRLSAEEHVLLLCMHHVVSDGWSMGVLQREISALYGAFSRGGPSPLPDLPVQYPDYALWQRARLSGEALDRQLAYWRERLAGAPAVLDLPTDRPRPIMQVYHGAVHQGRLPGELRRELRALAQREGGTLFMVLIAAFKVLLSRYSEQQDLVVGTPVAGREHAEVEGLVGFFVNTLALRTDLSGEPTFTELLARVRETSLGAFAHADVPFERLLAELRPERTLNRQPLFQAMFGLQNTPRASFQVEGLVARPFPLRTTTAKFDLTLMVGEDEGGIETRIEYSTELFDPRTIERLGEHYRVLLEGILAGPGRRIPELPLLTPEEWQRVVVERNATGRECPRGCMHTLFQEQAARTPHVPAVAWDGGRMSYSELDLRSTRLAHALRGYGVGPEVRVGIWLERGPDMVVSLLAVLKAGGAYVPVDPAYPRERTACVLRDSGVRVLLTQDRFRDRLPEHAARVIRVDGDWAEIGRQSATAPRVEVAPDNLAYVIYTSGSTGTPKGVMVPHGGLANYLAWASGAYAPGTRGGAPVHSSLSF